MTPLPLSRRDAIRRILTATALASTLNLRGFAAELESAGIGWDPNLLKKEIPWPRLLTPAEKEAVTALADAIIPADEFGPAASAVGVPDFIDEWVSAPYDQQRKDRKTIRDGLAWIDAEAARRFGAASFAASAPAAQTALLDEIARGDGPGGKQARTFFLLLRDRVAGGYFTTPEGWKALGYTGNVPIADFPGPPPEALQHIGLA
jgi:hypothetical protein